MISSYLVCFCNPNVYFYIQSSVGGQSSDFLPLHCVEVVENDEEECDTDLERQNVEELYDSVRHLHQSESQEEKHDVQHKALIPVLRPYQRQAVNWMLRREKFRITSPRGIKKKNHFYRWDTLQHG